MKHLLLLLSFILFTPFIYAKTPTPPNILWIVAEDISPVLGCYGHPDARTPNIDALAKGRDVEIDAYEGLLSKSVSAAVYESGKSRQVVKVSDVVSGKVNAYQKDLDRYWKL